MFTRLSNFSRANLAVSSKRPVSGRERLAALLLVVLIAGITFIVFPAQPAYADCTTEQWQNPETRPGCIAELEPPTPSRQSCLDPPVPSAPDSGLAGWFVIPQPEREGPTGLYSNYGYAGYSFHLYDIDCLAGATDPNAAMANFIADGELMLASGIIGASNALREWAWDPGEMWGWANPLVERATTAIYERVFTVFGAVTLAIVGLYLIWRSRQADMNDTTTTAGWAVFVMVIVTAVAVWPVFAANFADGTLVQTLGVVHSAIGPRSDALPPEQCSTQQCQDQRPPAVRASDQVTEALLYENWLRGVLGSADSETARRYGTALYEASSLSWAEAAEIRRDPSRRQEIIEAKADQWMRIAEQIRAEDPEAYEHLQGVNGMERVGAGFITLLSALCFALFDITTSILIILGFLVIRWAVIAAPVIGTVAILRPASGGLKRLGNAVIAAIFNVVIFGIGAAVYLLAVSLILETNLPGWLQILLIVLCGIVGWILLRPYQRLTQLGGSGSLQGILRGQRQQIRNDDEPEPVTAPWRRGSSVEEQTTRSIPRRRAESMPDETILEPALQESETAASRSAPLVASRKESVSTRAGETGARTASSVPQGTTEQASTPTSAADNRNTDNNVIPTSREVINGQEIFIVQRSDVNDLDEQSGYYWDGLSEEEQLAELNAAVREAEEEIRRTAAPPSLDAPVYIDDPSSRR